MPLDRGRCHVGAMEDRKEEQTLWREYVSNRDAQDGRTRHTFGTNAHPVVGRRKVPFVVECVHDGGDHQKDVIKLRSDGIGGEWGCPVVHEHYHCDIIPDVPLPFHLLVIILRKGQQRRNVKHDFDFRLQLLMKERCIYRMLSSACTR